MWMRIEVVHSIRRCWRADNQHLQRDIPGGMSIKIEIGERFSYRVCPCQAILDASVVVVAHNVAEACSVVAACRRSSRY